MAADSPLIVTPAAQFLLAEHQIPSSALQQIPASGPGNRLLKADVLAHIGQIDPSYLALQSQRLDSSAKLALPAASSDSSPSTQSSSPEPVGKTAATHSQAQLQYNENVLFDQLIGAPRILNVKTVPALSSTTITREATVPIDVVEKPKRSRSLPRRRDLLDDLIGHPYLLHSA